MCWPHVCSAVGVVEIDNHWVKNLGTQVCDFIIPPLSYRAVESSTCVEEAFKAQVCLDWVSSLRYSVIPIIQ